MGGRATAGVALCREQLCREPALGALAPLALLSLLHSLLVLRRVVPVVNPVDERLSLL